MIVSNPAGAKLYLDGEFVGKTPYRHTDSKIVGSMVSVKLEKEGYQPLLTDFSKNEEADIGAIIGGFFVWIPFLWTLKYKAIHTYELKPIENTNIVQENAQKPIPTSTTGKTKTDRLRELKKLLDENIITNDEFQKEKAKILDEKE